MMSEVEVSAVDGALSADGMPLPIAALVFTPYQLLFLETLVRMIAPRPIFLVDARPERFRRGRAPSLPGAVVREIALTGEVTDSGQSRLVRDAIAAIEGFAGGAPFAFLCASFQWPANNAFYTRHRHDPAAHFFLIEDGLSTFLDLRPSTSERARNLLREAVVRLRGFPRRTLFGGHPLGLDLPGVERIFVGAAPLPEVARDRPFRRIGGAGAMIGGVDAGAVLFVGQPYIPIYGAAVMVPFLTRLRDDLVARGFTRIAMKPHHFQAPDELGHYLDLGFEIVDPPVTVEEMIAASPYRTVASINSSALLTVRSLYGDSVRAIAYGPGSLGPAHERRDRQQVVRVFRHAGVEIVDP